MAAARALIRRGGETQEWLRAYRGDSLIRNTHPTIALRLGTYGDPRGVGVSYERGTPVACFQVNVVGGVGWGVDEATGLSVSST